MWFNLLKTQMQLDTRFVQNPSGMRTPKTNIQIPEPNITTNVLEQSSDGGSDDSGSDDSDVGETWRNTRSLMVQSPRGPKKRQLVQALSILANASIDPVNQKNLAIQAKQKLKEAFPTEG
jgi:hypothetical protein